MDNQIYIYIYTTLLILICFIFYHYFSNKTTRNSVAQNSLNYSSVKTSQSIAAIDSSGNISALSYPTGMIMLWYPSDSTLTSLSLISSTVPVGWAICDGTQGTPDLRGRFVLMAQDSAHPIMSTGGAVTHTLTEAEMPRHTHASSNQNVGIAANGGWKAVGESGFSSYTGGDQPHNNMPPFYTLVYIMKL